MTEYSDPEFAGGIANVAIYSMCRNWPSHLDHHQVFDKVKLIAKFYEVSRNLGGAYAEIARSLVDQGLHLDQKLDELRGVRFPACKDAVIELHQKLDELVCGAIPAPRSDTRGKRAGVEKKVSSRASFVSKYLHFHLPDAFPILDSFTEIALRKRSRLRRGEGKLNRYAQFCLRLERVLDTEDLASITLRKADIIFLQEGRAIRRAST